MKTNLKIYLIFTLIVLVILGFWYYSLKINLENGLSTENSRSGFTLSELKQEIADILSKSPLTTNKQQPTVNSNNEKDEQLDKLVDELAEELKNKDNNTSTFKFLNE